MALIESIYLFQLSLVVHTLVSVFNSMWLCHIGGVMWSSVESGLHNNSITSRSSSLALLKSHPSTSTLSLIPRKHNFVFHLYNFVMSRMTNNWDHIISNLLSFVFVILHNSLDIVSIFLNTHSYLWLYCRVIFMVRVYHNVLNYSSVERQWFISNFWL